MYNNYHNIYPMFWSKPNMYDPKSSSWFVHDSKIFLWTLFGSDSTLSCTEATVISHFSDIVTVQPVNFSWSNAYNFSLVRADGPGSSILIFDVKLLKMIKKEIEMILFGNNGTHKNGKWHSRTGKCVCSNQLLCTLHSVPTMKFDCPASQVHHEVNDFVSDPVAVHCMFELQPSVMIMMHPLEFLPVY